MKTVEFSLAGGQKIAVHCHAGRGRTALIICAYLIYSRNMTAEQAIKHFKEKRTGSSLSKKSQKNTLYKFEECNNIIILQT